MRQLHRDRRGALHVRRGQLPKRIGRLALAAGCLLTTAASPALASYYPSGPQTFVKKSKLAGWDQCFKGLYRDSESLDTVLNDCDGDPLLLAGGRTGSKTLRVLAAAPRADVLFDTGQTNTPHDANGSGWYYNADYSWGFAGLGDPLLRDSCDVEETNPDLRLCWHTDLDMLAGGYRAGAKIELNDSENYTRYIYQGPPCPKDTLCVWKHSNYQGKRLTIEGKGVSNEIAQKMDDAVSSFYNRRDGVAYLYEDKNAHGPQYCIPQHGYLTYIGDLYNDVVSSSKLTNQVVPSEEPPC